ncbi:hypothetical protein ACR3K2_11750 [Cryptosporidium serpentis]
MKTRRSSFFLNEFSENTHLHLTRYTSQEETIDVEEFYKDWRNFESDKNDKNSLDEPLPLELERLSTYIAVNPATLDDDELWPTSSLRDLCIFLGLHEKGNRKMLLDRLQAWNEAPLSGAGHPDCYDTKSARLHTIPMAFVAEKNKFDENDFHITNSENMEASNFESPAIKRTKSPLCTPNSKFPLLRSHAAVGTPDVTNKSSKLTGRISFSPYNHVRVFVSNPDERELSIDTDLFFRIQQNDYSSLKDEEMMQHPNNMEDIVSVFTGGNTSEMFSK